MTVAVANRRFASLARGDGGRPARRAVIRWAWRLFRREWRQQLLVLALLTLAVAATTLGAAVAPNAASRIDSTMGVANFRLSLPGSVPNLGADIAAIQHFFGTTEVVAHESIPVPGSVASVDLRDQSPTGPYGSGTLRLKSGRYPSGPDEVALAPEVATTFGLRVGDVWQQGGVSRRVVGLVENPQNLLDQFALVAPGQLHTPSEVSILVDSSQAKFRAFHLSNVPLDVEGSSNSGKAAVATAVLALGTIGLLFVGLLAVAGFTVMAQRRMRALGMLGAMGATDRHIRLVMLANGAVVGTVAAVTGTAIGLIGWVASVPWLETTTGHRINRFDLTWWAIGAAMVLAILTAIAAAWWPARSAVRVPVVAALSGRPPRPQPAHRFAALGGLLLAAGLVLLAFADESTPNPPLIVAGIVTTTVSVLLLAPLGIAGLAACVKRAPVAVRLAVRDLARYQARSGAALAAVTLAVGIAATIAISASASQAAVTPTLGNLPTNELIVYLSGDAGSGPGAPLAEQTPAQLQAAQTRLDDLVLSLHGQAVELDEAVNPTSPDVPLLSNGQAGKDPASLVKVTPHPPGFDEMFVAPLYVGTPALLEHFGIKQSEVDPTADVISSRTDLAGLDLHSGFRNPSPQPRIQPLNLPKYTSDPNALITTGTVQRLGLQILPAGWLVRTAGPLTTVQISAARHLAAAAGLAIETRKTQQSLTGLRNWSTAVGLLVALGVLAMTVGLIRSEAASDLRTLAATGASSVVRRNLTGATAGALAMLGGVLGTGGAYIALIAWHRSDLSPLGHVPVTNVIALIVGFPLAAIAAGWLLAGREPSDMARQPLE